MGRGIVGLQCRNKSDCLGSGDRISHVIIKKSNSFGSSNGLRFEDATTDLYLPERNSIASLLGSFTVSGGGVRDGLCGAEAAVWFVRLTGIYEC